MEALEWFSARSPRTLGSVDTETAIRYVKRLYLNGAVEITIAEDEVEVEDIEVVAGVGIPWESVNTLYVTIPDRKHIEEREFVMVCAANIGANSYDLNGDILALWFD